MFLHLEDWRSARSCNYLSSGDVTCHSLEMEHVEVGEWTSSFTIHEEGSSHEAKHIGIQPQMVVTGYGHSGEITFHAVGHEGAGFASWSSTVSNAPQGSGSSYTLPISSNTPPGVYIVTGYGELGCDHVATVVVLKVESVYVSFGDEANAIPGYDHEAPVRNYLTNLGATYDQANSVWTYDDLQHFKRFEVRIVGAAGFAQALQKQDAYVAFRGHSNYGIGLAWDKTCQSIGDFMNVGTPNSGVVWSGILSQQQNLVIADADIATNPVNYITSLGYERFANSAGTYQGQNVPDIGTTAPSNVFSTIYGTGQNRFHYYALSGSQNPSIILKVRYSGCDDLPTLRYKWLFIDSCYSGLYYADSFSHGVFFYATTLEYLQSDSLRRFVQAVIEGKTPAELEATLDVMDDELGHPTQVNYEYKSN